MATFNIDVNNWMPSTCDYCGSSLWVRDDYPSHLCFADLNLSTHVVRVDRHNISTIAEINDEEATIKSIPMNCQITLRDGDDYLINAVKQRPALYKSELFIAQKAVLEREAIWKDIAALSGGKFSVGKLQTRWTELRTAYLQQRKLSLTIVTTESTTRPSQPEFCHFRALTFLNDDSGDLMYETQRDLESSFSDGHIDTQSHGASKTVVDSFDVSTEDISELNSNNPQLFRGQKRGMTSLIGGQVKKHKFQDAAVLTTSTQTNEALSDVSDSFFMELDDLAIYQRGKV